MRHPKSRRAFLKTTAAATAFGASRATAAPATTAATTRGADVTAATVAASELLGGRDPYTPAEREMMTGGLSRLAKTLRRLRAVPIPADVESPAGFAVPPPPPGPSTVSVSDGPLDYNGQIESLAFAPVTRLGALIAARKVTSETLTRMYLARLKTIGVKLRCVINLTEDLAMSRARRADAEIAAGKSRGPLHGIPWGAKDLLATKGIPTTWGVKVYEHQLFDDDADVVKRLDAAGAVLCAKLSLGELAMDDVWFGGMTRNPWAPDEGSGGSSAGPGAAVAAGLIGFAIGSETLGSIIDPSVKCGVTGLRPTYDLVPRRGAMALAQTMDKLGPMCRSVDDCALVLKAIKQPQTKFAYDAAAGVKGLRVAVDAASFASVKDPARRKLFYEALERLKADVGELRSIKLPSAATYAGLSWLTIDSEAAANFADLLTSGRIRELAQQDEGNWPNTFRVGATIPAADYLRAQRLRRLLQREMAAAMDAVDAYVAVPFAGPTIQFTNLCGYPSCVTRCGMHAGRPVSIEVIGNLYREDAALAVANAISKSVGEMTWPDVSHLPD